MDKLVRVFIVVAALLLSMFSIDKLIYNYNHTEEKIVSKALDLPIENATVKESLETHGGFLGDGETFIALSFPDGSLAEKIKAKPGWEPLPLSRRLHTLLYGSQYYSSPFQDEEGSSRFSNVTNGYYYFVDKQNSVENPHDDTNLFSRGSRNVIIAVYDADTSTLYYCEYDT